MHTLLGYAWLEERFCLESVQPLPVSSSAGGSRVTRDDGTTRHEVWPQRYHPEDTIAGHLSFAFRNEGIFLEQLARLYSIDEVKTALEGWINREPTGVYARRAGFLYEWLTGGSLNVADLTQGNYADALPLDQFFTGDGKRNRRWRIRDNLPGTPAFCPMVRRTSAVVEAEGLNMEEALEELEHDYGADLVRRSCVWLTIKESRASFLIEHEQKQEDRIRRFAAVMEQECGREPDPLAFEYLQKLQADILGPNALVYGIRRSPVYVGHTAGYEPVVDYIAPSWQHVPEMLHGLSHLLGRTASQSSLLRAAVVSFAFVYVHPMSDGNGRISRFLINDVLRRDDVISSPLILPVSATITDSTRQRADYDHALESFSRPLMQTYADKWRFGETEIAPDGREYNLHFDAYDEALPAWRYPDLTSHVAYLHRVLEQTIRHEMRKEADTLKANDQARREIKEVLEAPDMELDTIIRSITQNGFQLSNKLIKRYPLLAENSRFGTRIVEIIKNAFKSEE